MLESIKLSYKAIDGKLVRVELILILAKCFFKKKQKVFLESCLQPKEFHGDVRIELR